MSIIIIISILSLLIFYLIGIYNSLIILRNGYKNSFAQIDVQLQRRYDLIPNLIETAKGYMKHERETLEGVISARNQAITARGPAATNPGDTNAMNALSSAESTLSGALTKFFALAESYPDLKANTTMNQLMSELKATEDSLAFSRKNYNDAVTKYNTSCEIFPNSFVANNFGFAKAELLNITDDNIRQAPKVSF